MSSVSGNPADQSFIGIDPDDTVEVEVGGAKFTLGVIPAGVWDVFTSREAIAFEDAKRRMIRDISAKGEDPEEPVAKLGVARYLMMAMSDEEYIKQRTQTHADALAYGLRGHSNFLMGRAKKEVPFELESKVVGGVSVQVVGDKTMRVYRANPKLVDRLHNELRVINEIGLLAKKA